MTSFSYMPFNIYWSKLWFVGEESVGGLIDQEMMIAKDKE